MKKQQKSLILVIDESNLTHVETCESGSFEELKIWERSHIQEWIRKSPEVLGEELLVLSIEFDRFVQSNDRLDILAMDKVGNLVVVELKRDNMAGYADLQSLRYASMISTLTLKSVLPYYLDYNNKSYPDNPIDITKAEELINDFVEGEFDDFTLKPRIILCSENFSTELTTTVLWLRNQYGVDMSCVRIKPHKVGNKIIIVPTLIIPIPEAKQYQIDIQQKEEIIHSEKTQRTRRPTSIRMLLEKNLIKAGDILQLSKDKLPGHLQPFFDGKESNYYQVKVTGKSGKANNVVWLFDNEEYSITNVSHHIFMDLHPEHQHSGALSGADYWTASNGKTLYDWAHEVWHLS
jgi:hypothetical protein